MTERPDTPETVERDPILRATLRNWRKAQHEAASLQAENAELLRERDWLRIERDTWRRRYEELARKAHDEIERIRAARRSPENVPVLVGDAEVNRYARSLEAENAELRAERDRWETVTTTRSGDVWYRTQRLRSPENSKEDTDD